MFNVLCDAAVKGTCDVQGWTHTADIPMQPVWEVT